MPFIPYFFNDTPTELEQIIKNSLENFKQSGDIEELKKIIPELNKRIAQIATDKLNEWYENGSLRTLINTKKILIVGDSYLSGQGIVNPEENNYGALLRYQGFDVTSISSPGGGFVVYGDNGRFIDMIANFAGSQEYFDSFTDVLFLGGVNDSYGDLSSLNGLITQTVANTRAKFRNAMCHIGYISQLRRLLGNVYNIKRTKKIYKNACLEAKCCYIDNSDTMLKNVTFIQAGDGTHPTVAGQRAIANYLTSYLLNGNISTSQVQELTDSSLTLTQNFVSGVFHGSIEQNNNICTMFNRDMTAFQVSSDHPIGFEFDGINSFVLGTINDSLMWGQSDGQNVFGAAQATIAGALCWKPSLNSETEYVTHCPFTLRIVRNIVFVTPQIMNNHTEWTRGYAVQINLNPFTAVFSSSDI